MSVLCNHCDGSGEGRHDRTRCDVCRGKGVLPVCARCDEPLDDLLLLYCEDCAAIIAEEELEAAGIEEVEGVV
jgi:RecJ-like exonuclease